MQERLAAETAETAKPPAAPVAHGSPVVMRMLALQRGAGNRAAQKNRAEYEDDPVLYTKSTYYSPKEI